MINRKSSKIYKILDHFIIYLMLISLLFRGVLEEASSKQIAYLLQLIVVAITISYWIFRYKLILQRNDIMLLSGFLIFASLSTIYTLLEQNFFGGAYLAINILYVLIALVSFNLSKKMASTVDVSMGIAILGIVLLVFGIAQQFLHTLYFPGMSEISLALRPSSLTGSYLHYPIILSIIGLISFNNRLNSIKIMGLLMLLGVFLTYSRSGMFIIVFTLIVNSLLMLRSKAMQNRVLISYVSMVFIIFFVSRTSAVAPYIDRIVSSTNLEESSNNTRLNYWGDGIKMILESPIIIGDKTGMVTNLSRNFNLFSSSVVESSILQQIINFGLIGALIFYFIMFKSLILSRRDGFMASVALACLIQTSFYQTFEVFPFVVLFSLIPYFSYLKGETR